MNSARIKVLGVDPGLTRCGIGVVEGAQKVFELIDAIEELDDVQNVFGNFDVSDEVMASLS